MCLEISESRPALGYGLGYVGFVHARNHDEIPYLSHEFESERAHQSFIHGRLGLSAGVRWGK